jgi:hypothetical protein
MTRRKPMSSDICVEVQDRWRKSEVAQIDGVLFDTGEMILMDCAATVDAGTGQIEVSVSPLAEFTAVGARVQ